MAFLFYFDCSNVVTVRVLKKIGEKNHNSLFFLLDILQHDVYF
jgi:hypothetical protein